MWKNDEIIASSWLIYRYITGRAGRSGQDIFKHYYVHMHKLVFLVRIKHSNYIAKGTAKIKHVGTYKIKQNMTLISSMYLNKSIIVWTYVGTCVLYTNLRFLSELDEISALVTKTQNKGRSQYTYIKFRKTTPSLSHYWEHIFGHSWWRFVCSTFKRKIITGNIMIWKKISSEGSGSGVGNKK